MRHLVYAVSLCAAMLYVAILGLAPKPSRADRERAHAVIEEIRFSFEAYSRAAWGRDELLPLTGSGVDTFCGTGATIVDSLDTLWLAGLRDHFRRGADWVLANLTLAEGADCSTFEVNIRVVGGLLSAGQLSGDSRLIGAAERLARSVVERAWTAALPCPTLLGAECGEGSLAEAGTFALEFSTLSRETGDASFVSRARRAMERLGEQEFSQGCPLRGSGLRPEHAGECTAGLSGYSDSYYVYLLKAHLMAGEQSYLRAWRRAMAGAEQHFFRCSDAGRAYIGKVSDGAFVPRVEHLACFAPGMLLLGGYNDTLALSLLDTCVALYTKEIYDINLRLAAAGNHDDRLDILQSIEERCERPKLASSPPETTFDAACDVPAEQDTPCACVWLYRETQSAWLQQICCATCGLSPTCIYTHRHILHRDTH